MTGRSAQKLREPELFLYGMRQPDQLYGKLCCERNHLHVAHFHWILSSGSSPVAIAAALLSGSSLATGLFLVSSGFVRANTEAMLAF